MKKWCYQKHELNDEDYAFFLNKSKLLQLSLTLFKNDLVLLNNILKNELSINFFDFWTIDNGPDSNRTGNKTFLRMPIKTRSKFCESFHRVAETSNTFARLNSLLGYDFFQDPVIFRKNLNLSLVDKLQTYKYPIYPQLWFLSLYY